MRYFNCFVLLMALSYQNSFAQKIPDGYILQYQQDFNNGKSLTDFVFENPASWGVFNVGGNFYLQCTGTPDSTLVTTLPANIAILNNKIFGDFILEANVMPGANSSEFGETCLFFGIKDLTRYYYVQLASLCDSVSHGIYLVKNSNSKRLTGNTEQPVKWTANKWHKIRLERNIVKRTMLVFVDDMAHPSMQIKDYELVMGMVGFGSVSSPGRFDNIRIWAPTVISNQ
jgi:hypothetical protein